jgi:hypothetical protein
MNKVFASILEIAIKESLANYETKENRNSLGDLYLYHDSEDNSLVIYDDTNLALNKVQLPDDQFFNLTHILRQILHHAGKEQFFEKNYIVKPFTISMVDKDFIILDELFSMDDNSIKGNDITWKNIEKDLDDFLKDLLQ